MSSTTKLTTEKQLAHRIFCDDVDKISDRDKLKQYIKELHLLMLGRDQLFNDMLKNKF